MYLLKRRSKIRKIKKTLLLKCPQKKGTCFKVTFMKPKKPNSATRKVTKVTFLTQKRKTFCHIPGIKHNVFCLSKFSLYLIVSLYKIL
jgi:small subunit ribosomal protein S12